MLIYIKITELTVLSQTGTFDVLCICVILNLTTVRHCPAVVKYVGLLGVKYIYQKMVNTTLTCDYI